MRYPTPKEHPESPDRFAWLLSPADPPRNEPSPAEFAAACDFALHCWQVIPALSEKLLAWGGKRNAGSPAAQRVRDRATGLTVFAGLQMRICQRLTAAFDRERIPYALLKGSAVRLMAYPSPELRCGHDIDLAVPRSFLKRTEQLSREHGFLPSQWSPRNKRFYLAEPTLRAMVEAKHHELGFLVRRQRIRDLPPEQEQAIRRDVPSQHIWHLTGQGELACYVSIDVHHGLSLDIQAAEAVRSASPWRMNGYSLRLPAPEWVLFHVIYKLYWEGVHNYRKGVYQYADLSRLLPKLSPEEFARARKLLAEYRLEAAGYYVLRRLESDLKMPLRADHKEFLAEAAVPGDEEPVQVNDLGDMWPKLWGMR